MLRQATVKARDRLRKANTALAGCAAAGISPDFKDAWGDFLLALNGVFSVLEQGAKGAGKSEAWFGRIKGARRKDPLLTYLHQARNADEHGVASVVLIRVQTTYEAIDGSEISMTRMEDNAQGPVWQIGSTAPLKITSPGPEWSLTKVRDTRYGDEYAPPQTHLGQPIPDDSPISVGKLAVAYCETVIAEAEALPQRP